jgi:hypothetical protein
MSSFNRNEGGAPADSCALDPCANRYDFAFALQLASGFLVEVGNGQQDKFIFDLGTGAYINLWATGVPFSKLNKVRLP